MSIASEITRLQGNKADIKAQVNIDKDLINGGTEFIDNELTDDYDDKIEEMQEAYKKYIPIQTESGTEIQIDNSGNDKALVNIGLDGNIEQTTYTGSNLMSSGFEQGARSNSTGGDGWVTSYYVRTINPISVEENTTYKIALNGVSNSGDVHFFNGNTFLSRGSSNETITTPANCNKINIQFYNANGITPSNMGLAQLNKGSTILAYEPYVGGTPSPSPSFPQDIKVVTGENTIDIVGRNLLANNSSSQTISGISYVVNSNKSISFSGTATATSDFYIVGASSQYIDLKLNDGSYTLSGCADGSGTTYMLYVVQNRNGTLSYYQQTTTGLNLTIQKGDTFRIFIRVMNGQTVSATISPQLEQGSTASTYEEYQSQSYTIDLDDVELCKIENYQDYIYQSNGTWYKHSEIGKVVLNGTEAWSISSTNTTGYNRFTSSVIYNKIIKPSSTSEVVNVYSNSFIKVSADNTYARINGLSIGTNGNIYIYDDDFKEYTAEQFKTWLNSHNTEAYYVLETPTTTEITNEALIGQLEAVKLLSGTQNNFTIDADTLPTLNLNYIGEVSPHL